MLPLAKPVLTAVAIFTFINAWSDSWGRSCTPTALASFLYLGGFLGQRFQANRLGRLKDPLLSEEFIRLHERKNRDGWFWLGEQIGK